MANNKSASVAQVNSSQLLPSSSARRNRRVLIIPRLLAEAARDHQLRGEQQDRAYLIIQKWADLETAGTLARKETSLDADFLLEVFGQALDYRPFSTGEKEWQLERQFTVPGIGAADGALGHFSTAGDRQPVAVILLSKRYCDCRIGRVTNTLQRSQYLHQRASSAFHQAQAHQSKCSNGTQGQRSATVHSLAD